MTTIALKTIHYRGGIARFRIPANWVEEYEEAGGGVFYAPGDKTGTLRLNILRMSPPAGQIVDSRTASQVLEIESKKYNVPIVVLSEYVAMVRYDLPGRDRGHSLKIRYWRLAQSLPPHHVRLPLFSYTLFAEQFDDAAYASELELLDREIAAVELVPVLGQIDPEKPWWRFW